MGQNTCSPVESRYLPWIMWSFGALFYCYQYLLRVGPSVMVPHMMQGFNVDAAAVGGLISSYYIAYSLAQIPIGLLLDRYGPRPLLTASAFFCAVGTFIFAMASNIYVAGLGRFIVGVASASGYLGCLKLGTLWFHGSRLGLIAGITMSLGMVGATMAGKPLSLAVEHFDWRWVMNFVALIGVGLSALLWFVVQDHSTHQEKPVSDMITDLIANVKVVIKNPMIWLIALYASLMYVPMSSFADAWGVHYISERYHTDRPIAAFVVTMIFWGVGIGAPIFAWWSDRLGQRRFPMLIAAIGSSLLYCVLVFQDIPFNSLYITLFLAGFFFTGQCLSFACVAEYVPTHLSGVATGFNNMIVMLSGVVAPDLIGQLLNWSWQGGVYEGLKVYTEYEFKIALATIPISLILSIVLVLFIKEKKQHAYALA